MEERLIVVDHAADRVALEYVGAILNAANDAIGTLVKLHGEVELGRIRVHGVLMHLPASDITGYLRFKDKGHLYRDAVLAAGISGNRAGNVLEGDLLMRKGIDTGTLDGGKHVEKRAVIRKLRP